MPTCNDTRLSSSNNSTPTTTPKTIPTTTPKTIPTTTRKPGSPCKPCGPGGKPCFACPPQGPLCKELLAQLESLKRKIRRCVCAQDPWLSI
ncbi:uncharacterized protein Dvir_GJ26085 [Drosophila virilis]|uniref:Uncharacterized protein n=1 Tax=Drosophila virilis TaxID=7244 RepID=A0A0Q9WL84_DROVI|nr:uncharacterized protein Dvir_GJ26085 [Drosophila virilis]